MDPSALEDVRVVEVGDHPAAAFAGRLLADLGADVIRLERGTPPVDDVAVGIRQYLHWNKRSAAIDDEASIDRLRATADVVLVGLRPNEVRGSAWDPERLRSVSPRVVLTYVSDFGMQSPFADYQASDLILAAMSGLMAISGSSAREPLKHGARTSAYAAGLNAAYASVAGILSAERTGHGVLVDLAVRDCLTSELVMNNAFHAFAGLVQGRPPRVADPLDGYPISGGRGYVSLQTSARQPISRLAEFFADPRLGAPEFATPELRVANSAALTEVLVEHLSTIDARDVFTKASDEGMVVGFVQGAGTMRACPQLKAREALTEVAGWTLPAELAALSRTPSEVRRRAPAPGADTAGVVAELTRPTQAVDEGRQDSNSNGPLAGLRVLDLSVIFAVPYLGALLADLGAEVIKIEAPARIDQTRTDWGGYFDNDPGDAPWNRSGTFQVVNRGKRSMVLDLSRQEGRQVFRELVALADVVVDNFTPRVMRRWQLTYDDLARINPGLITLSNTGYGSTGPWSSYKAQGTTLEATMGHMAATGYRDGPPTRAGQSVPDFYACWAGLLGLLAALRHRTRTGEGQHVDVGMYQVGAAMMPEAFVHEQTYGVDLPRIGPADADATFSAVVPVGEHGRWLAVSARTQAETEALASVVGAGESLAAALAMWATTVDVESAVAALQSRGVPAGPVNDAGDLRRDPQLAERGFYEAVHIPRLDGCRSIIGRPYLWSSAGSHVGIRAAAPDLGADTQAVLTELLGLDGAQKQRLYDAGVVADGPLVTPPARAMDVELLLAEGTIARREEEVLS